MKKNINFFLNVFYIYFLAQIQYKINFFASLISVLMDVIGNVLVLYFMFFQFTRIAGWQMHQVFFMYAIFLTGHGFVLMFAKQFWNFSSYIVEGELDRLCVRPRNILLQLLCSSFSVNALLYFLCGGGVLILAIVNLRITLTAILFIEMVLAVLSCAIIELSITIFLATLSFWVMKVSSLIYFNVEVVNEFLGYPMNIYNKVLRFIFTFIYPIAFMNYYPALYFLEPSKNNFYLFVITPILAITFFVFSNIFFSFGIKRYQSVGG